MSKKMAVRKKIKQQKEISFNFKIPNFVKSIFKVFLILGFFGGLSFAIMSTPILLPVKNISIEGSVKQINKSQLTALLSENDFTGMLSVDLQKIRMKVLENNWIKNVQIRKVWPDTLSFSFQEFQPLAKINEMYLVESGKLIASSAKMNADVEANLMLLSIKSNYLSENNSNNNYLTLLSTINEMQLNLNNHQLHISKFEVTENNNWFIQLEERFLIKLGRKKQAERIKTFLKVYAAIENKKQIESIDLRYNNGLAVKLFESVLNKQNKKQNG